MWTRRFDADAMPRRHAPRAAAITVLVSGALAVPSVAFAATPGEECDRVAAFDSTPAAKAVTFDELDAQAAIRACGAAIASDPNQPRYLFLLSRALLKAERYVEARDEAERAVKGGTLTAHILLAFIYEDGLGVAQNLTAARRHYRAAAEIDLTMAQIEYARMLGESEGGAKDETEAARWLKRAADSGSLEAATRLARLLSTGTGIARDEVAALALARRAAERGDAQAQLLLGSFYEDGVGVAKDNAAAAEWYGKAADQGVKGAATRLAALEKKPEGGALSKAAAAEARAAAVEGRRYAIGEGVAKDPARARELIKKSAAAGDSYGETLLGWLYEQGVGVGRDVAKAAALYERGVQKEEPSAFYSLGALLIRGGPGLPADHARALRLLTRARAAFARDANGPAETLIAIDESLSRLHALRGEYAESEAVLLRALDLAERGASKTAMPVTRVLAALAATYEQSGRSAEAEPLFARVMASLDQPGGLSDEATLGVLFDLSLLKERQGQFSAAADLLGRVRAQLKKAGAPPEYASLIDANLARVLAKEGRYEEADALLGPALREIDRLGMTSMPHAVRAIADHAFVRGKLGRLGDAEALYRKASALLNAAGIADHPLVLSGSIDFAEILERAGKGEEALVVAREASAHYAARLDRQGHTPRAQLVAERRAMRDTFLGHIALLDRQQSRAPDAGLAAESFEILQLANAASVSESISHGAARSVAGSDSLNRLAFERQTIVENWTRLNRQLASALVQPGDATAQTASQLGALKAIEASLARTDQAIKRDFPGYFDLTQSAPVSLPEVQKLLGPDEALVAYVLGRESAYAWAVTAKTAILRRLDGANARGIEGDIAVLRRALDPSDIVSEADLKPVDTVRLHRLYMQLLAPLGLDAAQIRHLLIVPDGPLNALPFHVLVTEPPAGAVASLAAYRGIKWLARRTAITVVPSVGALRALRAALPSRAPQKPFAGFGDPIFSADGSGTLRGARTTRRGIPSATLVKRGVVDQAALRALPALPDTADELKRIARVLAAEDSVFLQGEASEGRIKSMDLSQYGILAFATHGLISGELNGLDEPALALTVPEQASAGDDGLLTASEVALLNLNADWVILSACNTASGDGRPGADGLSGLARAFFVAGSRALLVSNWPVFSDAAAEVTTRMIERLRADPALRRSEALRLSMLDLLDDGSMPEHMAHPAAWAPFVVVGDGAALRAWDP